MPEPVSATAATLAYIGAGAATIGAVKATSDMATASSGFNVGRCHTHYPMQFPTDQFAHAGEAVGWDIIKFKADGFVWDNDLIVHASGYLSKDNTELVGRPSSDHPNTPVNRFIILTFDKSGSSENMSSGLLTVNINPFGGDAHIAEGTPEDPWIALRVEGRFDPAGFGDVQYSFKLGINTWGQLHLSGETYHGSGASMSITNQGDHIQVTLSQ